MSQTSLQDTPLVPRGRVVSRVEEGWGTGTVFSDDGNESRSEHSDKDQSTRNIPKSLFSDRSLPRMIMEESDTEASATGEGVSDALEMVYFESALCATVLEDTITELRILTECNTAMRISKTMADMTILRALKYGVKQPAVQDELDRIDPKKLGCMEYKLDKLDADRKYIGDVLLATYQELSLYKSFKVLSIYVEKAVNKARYNEWLAEDEAKNRIMRRDLARQLRQQRNHIKSVTYETDVIIDNLKTQVEDAALNAEIRSRYIDNWQRARTEQHNQTIADKEAIPSDVIELCKQRSDHEARVHSEIELLINIAINETLEKVEHWMNKYDVDMEAIDLKIQIQKNDYQNELDKRIQLEETYNTHADLMVEWNAFKDAREKERQYRLLMNKSAVIVQAWWRGLLVRKELGPYKVKKKGKAKGKKF